MATETICFTPIKGRVLRIVALDECGVPLCGTDADTALIVASGFTQVQQQADYDTGAEHILRTADSELCVNEKDPDAFKRMNLTIDFCVIDPGIVVTTVAPSRLMQTNNQGTGFALGEGISRKHWSLELWQRVTGPGACDPQGQQLWVYNAWPHIKNGRVGDYTVAVAPSQLQIMGETASVSPLWWVGEDWLGEGAISPVQDHWFQNVTPVPPPNPECGIQDLECPEES